VIKSAFAILIAATLASAPAAAQQAVPVIAIPPLSTPKDVPTKFGSTLQIAWQATQLIGSDLRTTAEVLALPPDQKDYYSYPEVTAPNYPKWRAAGVKGLLTGFVQARPDGRLAVGCYIYDIEKRAELGRIGFVVAADDWRRAAHKCSGLAYQHLVGAPGVFDTRIAYVARSGSGATEVTRIAVMDSDGVNHTYVTPGGARVVSPRLSRKADRVAYVSFASGQPQVRVADPDGQRDIAVLPSSGTTFAPRFSPDGNSLLLSAVNGGNTDIYLVNLAGGGARRLTTSPGIDTAGSFSPDGSRILFESDRSGAQQLYVMNSDGSDQRRVSFGGGAYASPAWSPDGERMAFVRRGPEGRRIGTMKADGSDIRLITTGPSDEGPSWAASSREIMFQRVEGGRTGLYRVTLAANEPRKVIVPQDGMDPDWSGVRE
jgi:TolB protein